VLKRTTPDERAAQRILHCPIGNSPCVRGACAQPKGEEGTAQGKRVRHLRTAQGRRAAGHAPASGAAPPDSSDTPPGPHSARAAASASAVRPLEASQRGLSGHTNSMPAQQDAHAALFVSMHAVCACAYVCVCMRLCRSTSHGAFLLDQHIQNIQRDGRKAENWPRMGLGSHLLARAGQVFAHSWRIPWQHRHLTTQDASERVHPSQHSGPGKCTPAGACFVLWPV